MYMPLFYDNLLMFAVQLEQDPPAAANQTNASKQSPQKTATSRSPSKSKQKKGADSAMLR